MLSAGTSDDVEITLNRISVYVFVCPDNNVGAGTNIFAVGNWR